MKAATMKLRGSVGDNIYPQACGTSAGVISVLMFSIFIALIIGAWPALQKFGPAFFVRTAWNPVTEEFGAANALYGTLASSVIAVALALPVTIYKFAMSPYDSLNQLAWSGALLITLVILILNVVSRVLPSLKKRRSS